MRILLFRNVLRRVVLVSTLPVPPHPLRCNFSPTAASMAQKFVDDEIKKPIAVFSKSYCPFCKMAKDTLNDAGAKYESIELDQRDDLDGRAIQDYLKELTHEGTVPRVFVGGVCIGGGTETRNLHQQKKLVPLLREAGAL